MDDDDYLCWINRLGRIGGMLAVGGWAAAVASTTTEDDTPKEKSRDSDITEIAEEERFKVQLLQIAALL